MRTSSYRGYTQHYLIYMSRLPETGETGDTHYAVSPPQMNTKQENNMQRVQSSDGALVQGGAHRQ